MCWWLRVIQKYYFPQVVCKDSLVLFSIIVSGENHPRYSSEIPDDLFLVFEVHASQDFYLRFKLGAAPWIVTDRHFLDAA